MSTADHVLRGVAAVMALAAVLVAANPQVLVAQDTAAEQQTVGDQPQREANSRTKGYTFLLESAESSFPGRWCAGVIPYSLDLAEVQATGMDPVAEAARWEEVFQRWSDASRGHYRFAYAGQRTLQIMPDGALDLDSVEPGTIGITYVNDDTGGGDPSHRAAAVRGRTAGNAGLQVTSSRNVTGGTLVGNRGFVMIDAEDAAALGGDGLRRSLYQHESGHALGLGHVDSNLSIMNGTLSDDREDLAAGDIAGLRALIDMPCEQ